MIPVYFNWSGGKDSSLALYYLLQNPEFNIKALVTTVNEEHQRISMHGVRRELLHEQAKQIGIPVHEILLPDSPNMSDYETAMNLGLQPLFDQGIRHCAFVQQFTSYAVHRNALMFLIDNCHKGFDIKLRILKQVIQRERTVFTTAPVEINRNHIFSHASFKNATILRAVVLK